MANDTYKIIHFDSANTDHTDALAALVMAGGSDTVGAGIVNSAGVYQEGGVIYGGTIASGVSHVIAIPSTGQYVFSGVVSSGSGYSSSGILDAGGDLTFAPAIQFPSDSAFTGTKPLTAGQLYIVKLQYSGTFWMLVSLVGGYA